MLRRTFYTLAIVVSGVSAQAQQDAQFTQYMFNSIYLTPAFAGVEGVTQITAMHRSQWLGYESSFNDGGAPTTQLISFTAPIYKLKSGFAAYVINDRLGPQTNQEAQAMYAYHLGLKDSKLSFGVKVGFFSQAINYEQYRAIHPDDPLLKGRTGKESQIRPDVGFGLYYRAEKFYLGAGHR